MKRVQRIISIFLSPVCLLFSLLRVASVLGFAAFMQCTYSEEVSMRVLWLSTWYLALKYWYSGATFCKESGNRPWVCQKWPGTHISPHVSGIASAWSGFLTSNWIDEGLAFNQISYTAAPTVICPCDNLSLARCLNEFFFFFFQYCRFHVPSSSRS